MTTTQEIQQPRQPLPKDETRQITDKSIIPFLKENRDKNRLAKIKTIFDNSTELKNEFLNFVQSIINYNQLKNSSSNNFANIKDYDKNLRQNLSFFATYSKYFIEYYGDDLIKNKNELYFYYWSSIFLMEYDLKEKCFNKNKTRYNKEYFDKNLIDFTFTQ